MNVFALGEAVETKEVEVTGQRVEGCGDVSSIMLGAKGASDASAFGVLDDEDIEEHFGGRGVELGEVFAHAVHQPAGPGDYNRVGVAVGVEVLEEEVGEKVERVLSAEVMQRDGAGLGCGVPGRGVLGSGDDPTSVGTGAGAEAGGGGNGRERLGGRNTEEVEANAQVAVGRGRDGEGPLRSDHVDYVLQLRVDGSDVDCSVVNRDVKLAGQVFRRLRGRRGREAVGFPVEEDAVGVLALVKLPVAAPRPEMELARVPAEVVDDVHLKSDTLVRPWGDADFGVAHRVLTDGDEGGAELGASIPEA